MKGEGEQEEGDGGREKKNRRNIGAWRRKKEDRRMNR